MSTSVSAPAADPRARNSALESAGRGPTSHPVGPGQPSRERRLGAGLILAGALGLLAAFVLAVEKYRLLTDSAYVPTCSINPVLSCGSVMTSPQAEAFGFPNPLLGLIGFSVVLVVGAALAGGAVLPVWFWAGLQVGVSAAVVFVHWLIAASLYRIGALCPYCMVVWVVVIALFVAVTARNLTAVTRRQPGPAATAAGVLHRRQGVIVTTWLLVIATLITVRFWTFWSVSLG
ncbi:vitamin K epoxide reductase family protein [Geodermatophilus sp. Leaf369]|uniref:vitamin K epoxide reductase family protein n=1 Tax=Geodermatophilus sp. Leaf369 TaxID=1736354 RepID=UPI0009E78D29|nr:vitamin K epoxide reductase family protein [Geodermatophilus sp. Leaf369]